MYLPHPFDRARHSLGADAERLCAGGMADIVEVFNAKITAAYLEMPDFDGAASFLTSLHSARVTGEYRTHAPRFRA